VKVISCFSDYQAYMTCERCAALIQTQDASPTKYQRSTMPGIEPLTFYIRNKAVLQLKCENHLFQINVFFFSHFKLETRDGIFFIKVNFDCVWKKWRRDLGFTNGKHKKNKTTTKNNLNPQRVPMFIYNHTRL